MCLCGKNVLIRIAECLTFFLDFGWGVCYNIETQRLVMLFNTRLIDEVVLCRQISGRDWKFLGRGGK